MNTTLIALIGFLLIFFDRRPYRKTIKRWSSLFHMKVRYHNRYTELFSVDVIEDILYISRYNKATHDDKEYLYSVAHEFGHLIDHAYKEYFLEEADLCDKLSSRSVIYRDEVVAWQIAEVLLNELEVFDKQAFDKLKERCLGEYRVALQIKDKPKKKKKPRKKNAKKS